MFRDVVAESRDCSHRRFSYDFKSIVQAAKLRDEDTATTEIKTKSMLPSGFVFHESRCGSTLIANSLVAADPIGHRVYSESGPPITALRACGSSSSSSNQCHPKSAAALLRDVIYMMGRTNDIHKEHSTFFKIQSIGTLSLPIFRLAFPSVPWIFVYRDPVHVMMSQLDVPGGDIRRSNCMRSMMRPSMEYLDAIQEHANGRSVNDLVGVEHCAAHLVRRKRMAHVTVCTCYNS